MERIKGDLEAKLAQPEWKQAWEEATGGAPDEEGYEPIYSFDNTAIHTDHDVLAALGLEKKLHDGTYMPTPYWMVLPTYSGDLHRTIERVHARICSQFDDWLHDNCALYEMTDYVSKLYTIFMTTQTHETIENCMWSPKHPSHSLSALYQSIVDCNGGIPPRSLR